MRPFLAIGLAGAVLTIAPPAPTQEPQTPKEWALAAARGVLDLCRQDAPDAAAVAEHGEIWGWPPFVPYTEHLDGYRREAGGQSRRSYTVGDATAEVEVTVQSGEVTEPATALGVRYFRCAVAANQPIADALEAYFTGLYGAPASKTVAGIVWLSGAAAGHDDALAATQAAGPGGDGVRIELSHELSRNLAKITEYRVPPAR